jgi:hypothetical protein
LNKVTSPGLGVGALFSYGFNVSDDRWKQVDPQSPFQLNVAGDTILVYCMQSDGSPHFLSGFSYAPTGWMAAGLTADAYGGTGSSLPSELSVNGSVAVKYFPNNVFNGASSSSTTQDQLLKSYQDPSNYVGANNMRYQLPALTSSADKSRGYWLTAGVWTAATAWIAMLIL